MACSPDCTGSGGWPQQVLPEIKFLDSVPSHRVSILAVVALRLELMEPACITLSAPWAASGLCAACRREAPRSWGCCVSGLSSLQHYSQREVQHAMEATMGWLWHANESSHAEHSP